jgi:hypothetical protein
VTVETSQNHAAETNSGAFPDIDADGNNDTATPLLEQAPSNPHPQASTDFYLVDEIFNSRRDRRGRYLYHVRWTGYKQTTWEPLENVETSTAFFEFLALHRRDPNHHFPDEVRDVMQEDGSHHVGARIVRRRRKV